MRAPDLFETHLIHDPIEPVRPTALDHYEWPPNYDGVYAWRLRTLALLNNNPDMLEDATAYYSTRPAEFIMHWMDTYDPRKPRNKWMPFIFFKRQLDMVDFLEDCRLNSYSGLMEKCRDAGATWVSCAYSVWAWLFVPDIAIGWGSRKETLVDKLGDADSIFEKLRLLVNRVPKLFHPQGFVPKQHATYMKLINVSNGATISGEAGDNIGRGGRKAQPLDALILTPTGYTLMGSIRVGDKVIGSSGKAVNVVGVYPQGNKPIYRVNFTDGTSTECCDEHLWHVTTKNMRKAKNRAVKPRGSTHAVLTTKQIMESGVFYNEAKRELNYQIPIVNPVEFDAVEPVFSPYAIGVMLGDGTVRSLHRTCPSFVTHDPEIAERFIAEVPDYVLVTTTDGLTYRVADAAGRQGRGVVSRVKAAFRSLGIDECGAAEKYVPDVYKFGSIATRHAILQGLMDTDGWVNERNGAGKVCFSSASHRLTMDVRFLVQSLGGTANYTVRTTSHMDAHTLTISMPDEFNPFHLKRKAERIGSRSKYQIKRLISSVELIGEKECQCIAVDANDNLYVTNDCIVTHNTMYFVDEAAHIERPEKVEAALGDNTNVRIDISSVNGLGNPFQRRREEGHEWYYGHDAPPNSVLVFIMDWSHHPEKTKEWYELRKARATREGMQHIFAQEVDRDYSAAISNTIIPYEWIQEAVDAHLKISYLAAIEPPDVWSAGLDVADEGEDRNALTKRQWIILRYCEEWGERDPGVATRRTIAACRPHRGIEVQYDCIGIGSAVKSEYNRLVEEQIISATDIKLIPWHAGAKVVRPYERVIPDDDLTPLNRDMFGNFKAQAWWSMRTRFYKTFMAIREGIVYPPEDLISLDSSNPLLQSLMKELAQPTRGDSSGLQMIVNKKPKGTKSPNLADSAVEAFFPAPNDGGHALVGRYGAGTN